MSRFRSLFFGRSTRNANPKGQSYDNTIAQDPPVKGSYPVAGNGPNVLEEIQRSRAKRDTRRQSTSANVAAAPNVPRYREHTGERPRTAPNDGKPKAHISNELSNGYHNGSDNGTSIGNEGRTRSGFSMKSPPSFFGGSRRSSLRNTVETPPVRTTQKRDIESYQPTKGVEEAIVPPFIRHNRSESNASHKSYVDLLEAHSNIKSSRELSKHRAQASGVRDYGEDVADRNLAQNQRDGRLDLNSPEFSYLRTVYSPKKQPPLGMSGSHSRTSSALGHVLGHGADPSDDIQPHIHHGKSSSVRSSAPRVNPRSNSPSVYSPSTAGRDDARAVSGSQPGPYDTRGKASSPLSTSSTMQDSTMRETLRQPGSTPDRGRRSLREPPPVVPSPKSSTLPKSFERTASVLQVAPVFETQQTAVHTSSSRVLKEPPPVDPPAQLPRASSPAHERKTLNSSTKQRQRAMSSTSQSTANATANGHKTKGSYSAFPMTTSPTDRSSTKSPTNTISKRGGMLVEERSEPISLEGVVDLSNTVDTDVTTKTLPAVTHEHITPTLHEIREERITREVHTHDVYHRILPVIETEILPTKHYVPSDDGKGLIEIPEHDLYKYTTHTVTGTSNGNWSIVNDARPRTHSLTQSIYSHHNVDENDGAESPVIGFARGEPKTRSRANSRASTKSGSRTKNIMEPVLSSKREYMTSEGHPKTEYVWRHPPVFEDAEGRTQPVYIGAGVGDLSSPVESYSDADSSGAEFGAVREDSLLFRDSGYDNRGMLPGLGQKGPVAGYQSRQNDVVGDYGERINYGRVLNHEEQMARSEGEATKALRRMQERRDSLASSASKGKGRATDVGDLQRGVAGLNVR